MPAPALTDHLTPRPTASAKGSVLAFSFYCYLIALLQAGAFIVRAAPATPRSWLFGAALGLSYAFIYILPTLIAIGVTTRLRRMGTTPRLISEAAIVLIATVSQLLLASDYVIQGMFGFHINGFVLNLITTPEGVDSMGADQGTKIVYALVAAGCLLLNTAAWWLLVRCRAGQKVKGILTGRRLKIGLAALLLMALGERVTYGIAHNQAWLDVSDIAASVPAYQPMTMRSLAKKLGFKMQRRASLDAPRTDARLLYPTVPLTKEKPAKPLNVVWLMCESLRADMLTPEIMPRTWAFAQESQRFTHHYSGGNGTRMGMFTAFYGIPGNYWFSFLGSRRPPLLVDRLQELDYRLHLSTSAAFSYPEFDKTLFAHVPAKDIDEHHEDQGWQSDQYHVNRMKNWLGQDDGKAPFFMFHFFESAHSRYYFPPEAVIRTPYLEDFNYATVNVKRDIELIRNRYINSVHGLDARLGDMIDSLRERNLLDSTVVIITGDHGEEFMENGRWGHNSEFSEQQLRVPFVLHVPGRAPGVSEHPTSHVDIVPTLLPLLGVKNPSADYSTGEQLFSAAPRLLTFADWDRLAFSDGSYKASFPLKAGAQVGSRITTLNDQPVKDSNATLRQLGPQMVQLKNMMSRFTQKAK